MLARVGMDQHRLPALPIHEGIELRAPRRELIARQPVLVPGIGADDDRRMDRVHR